MPDEAAPTLAEWQEALAAEQWGAWCYVPETDDDPLFSEAAIRALLPLVTFGPNRQPTTTELLRDSVWLAERREL